MRKRLFLFVLTWALGLPYGFAQTELLENAGFEESTNNPLLGTKFDSWGTPMVVAIESTDKVEGEQALKVIETSQAINILSQEISGIAFEEGAAYRLRIKYKVLTSQNGQDVKLDCLWESSRDGELEHDADKLKTNFFTANTWSEKVIETTAPAGASRFQFRVGSAKDVVVLYDDFSFQKLDEEPIDPNAPALSVTPTTAFTELHALINTTVDYPAVIVEQKNLAAPVSVSISGKDANLFRSSVTSTTEARQEVVFSYAPTAIGSHSAMVTIESAGNEILSQTVVLKGYCTDPNRPTTVSLTPSTLPAFTATVGQEAKQTVVVSSENCVDYVYASIQHIEGAAFRISSTMFLKNSSDNLIITFAPQTAGDYHSVVTVTTKGGNSVTLNLNGTATGDPATGDPIVTTFDWDMSNPLTYMYEHFDNIGSNNTPLNVERWQNVTPVGVRPWWGYAVKDVPEEKAAKATSYESGYHSTTDKAEMWLVTPPLDYKNTQGRTFTFRTRVENMYEGCPTTLSLYYIDANEEPVFFQTIDAGIPATPDENGDWREIHLDLSNPENNIADVFHMAFKYDGLRGTENGVIYYIDDVSWGRTDIPVIHSDSLYVTLFAQPDTDQTSGAITITTENLNEAISLSVAGTNASKFKLSTTSLPAEGGSFTVTFNNGTEEYNYYSAYVKLASRGAADLFIPLEAYVGSGVGINEIEQSPIVIVQEDEALRITAPSLQQANLYNTAGLLLNSYSAHNGTIRTDNLASGLYILSITTTEGTFTHKAIVE